MNTGIEFLRPDGKRLIIECVKDAGIDVTDWGLTKDGQPISRPQSNGAYCYDWSFRSLNGQRMVVCVWFEEISVDVQGRIVFEGNLRRYADTLIRELEKDPKNHKRTIKDPRINRAQYFSSTVQLAYRNTIPLNVVIVSGPVRAKDEEGQDFDRAVGRQLDIQSWVVESFDEESGAFVLVRAGSSQVNGRNELSHDDRVVEEPTAVIGGQIDIADQFFTEERRDTYTYNGIQRYRDPNVRRLVLNRSEGVCELTGVPGFLMANGRRYLETHHIIPLSEGGADTVENVIALSADAHRQAHFGANRHELRKRCQDIVARRIGC